MYNGKKPTDKRPGRPKLADRVKVLNLSMPASDVEILDEMVKQRATREGRVISRAGLIRELLSPALGVFVGDRLCGNAYPESLKPEQVNLVGDVRQERAEGRQVRSGGQVDQDQIDLNLGH